MSVANRQQAIFVSRKNVQQEVVEGHNPAEEELESDSEESQVPEESQGIEGDQIPSHDLQEEELSNSDGVEQENLPFYDPPTLEQVRERKEQDLFFRLLKKQGFTNGVLYKKIAEEIMEHPQAVQLISTLLQEFDIQSLSYDKFEKIDRSKIDQKTTSKPERRNSSYRNSYNHRNSSKNNTEKGNADRNPKHSRKRIIDGDKEK